MRRKLNLKLLGWLLGGLLLGGVGIHLVHGYQVQRNAAALLRQADRALEQKQLDQAAAYLANYLAYEPQDTNALIRYAQTLNKLAKSPAARFRASLLLQQALRRAPERDDLREEVVRVALDLEYFEEAARELEVLRAKAPGKTDVLQRLAFCREALGDYPRAAEAYRRAIAQQPTVLLNYQHLADLLHARRERPAEAAKVLDDMVAANPRSFEAFLCRARYRSRFGSARDAWNDVSRAHELSPDQPDVLLARAELAPGKDELAVARDGLRRGLERHPQDVRLYKTLARLEHEAGQTAAAATCLRRGLKAVPDSDELLAGLAEVLVHSGTIQEAGEVLSRLRRQGSAPAVADYLEARLLARQGQWGKALPLLEKARPLLPTPSFWPVLADLLLGQCYEQLGDTNQQLAVAQRAVALDPASAAARLCLGSALLHLGRTTEAVMELRPAAGGEDVPPQTWGLLGRALVLQNLRLPEEQRNWREVEEVLERAVKAESGWTEATVLQAEVLAARKQPEQASTLLEKALRQQPKQVLLWTTLADLAGRQGKFADATALLENARGEVGDQLLLRLAWVRYWTQKGGPEAGRELARLEKDPGQLTAEEQTRLRRELADTFLRLGDTAAAARLWQELANRYPSDLSSRFLLFDLALQTGQDDTVRHILDDLRRIEGADGVLWRFGEAARLVALAGRQDQAALEKARAQLAEVQRRQPHWSRLAILEGALADAEGNSEAALRHYLRGLKQDELQPRVVARATRLLYERRRYAEADEMLRKVEELMPLGPELARLGAEIALQTQDVQRAQTLARQAVSAASRDYRDHLWLARVLETAGRPAEAEETLRRATRTTGNIPDPWVALVRHLVQTGQRARAEEVLADVRREVSAARVPLTLARCYEALGQPEQAERLFREQQAARPDDFMALRHLTEFYLRARRPAEAEPLLRRLLAPATRAPLEIAARARRQLAVQLAAGTRPEQFREALALLERNVKFGGATVDDDRARAAVLATRPEQRREALQLFERSLDRREPTPDEQFLLVQLYEANGAALRARDLMLGLLAANGDNADYLAHHIRSLVQRREVEEARFYLARLERLEPRSARTQELKSTLQKASALNAAQAGS